MRGAGARNFDSGSIGGAGSGGRVGSGLSWGIRSRLADQDSRDIAPLMQHLQPVQTANLFITRALCLEPRIQSGSGERKGDRRGSQE